MEQIYTPKQDYKVLVRCFTYNQSKYIEDTLNGFAMQQTNFPFVCLVMDDCSTDGEQEVIKAWMERECDMEKAEYIDLVLSKVIIVTHKANENCTFAFYLLNINLYKDSDLKFTLVTPWREHCEYEALCEGDDYWIAEDKLQMQVEFLDKNLGYGLVRTDANSYLDEEGRMQEKVFANKIFPNCNDSFENFVVDSYWLATCTWTYRTKFSGYSKDLPSNCFKGDLALILYIAEQSKIKYLDDCTSVYRVLKESASHSKSWVKHRTFIESVYNTRIFYAYSLSFKKRIKIWLHLVKDTRPFLHKNIKGSLAVGHWVNHAILCFKKLASTNR